ncbi:MAG: hypothetical protein ABSG72_23890, partial [Candidatus Sulfotelmatobacter sp.]
HRVSGKFRFGPWAATSCGQNLERQEVAGQNPHFLRKKRARNGAPGTRILRLLLAYEASRSEWNFSVKVG